MTVGRTWALYAHASRGTHWHLGAKQWVELHGLDDPIVPVLAEEWLGDARAPEVTHYGWEDTDKPGHVVMIWPRARDDRDRGHDPVPTPWMLLGMCFPYGMQVAVDHGDGKMVALRVTEREG